MEADCSEQTEESRYKYTLFDIKVKLNYKKIYVINTN